MKYTFVKDYKIGGTTFCKGVSIRGDFIETDGKISLVGCTTLKDIPRDMIEETKDEKLVRTRKSKPKLSPEKPIYANSSESARVHVKEQK